MKGHAAFARAVSAFALIAAAMRLPTVGAQQVALSAIPQYESNGKGKTVFHHAKTTRRDQRAARKRRNVLRNRKAHRG